MANLRIDCRYDACPIPLLKAAQMFPILLKGEILLVEIGHMCAAENIIEWAQKRNIETWMEEDERTGDCKVYLKKT
jgi:TusA-related sulfurtransferase